MDGDIFLYHLAKWGGSDPQCLSHRLDVQDLSMGVKSDHGICALHQSEVMEEEGLRSLQHFFQAFDSLDLSRRVV